VDRGLSSRRYVTTSVACRFDADETPDWLIEAFEGGEEPSTPAAGTVVEP